MFVIVTYDVEVGRIDRVRKLLRRYLNWVQNSVFEGEITLSNLAALERELLEIIEDDDSIYIYKVKLPKALEKETLGEGKGTPDNFL
ncbi:CRISPR-associated endonuclease Cas2 [Thermovibrio sp.]